MYVVFQSGSKQHRVSEGQTIHVEKLEQPTGQLVDFSHILMVAHGDQVKIGAPFIDGSKVTAEIVAHGRADKIKIVKFRRRKHSRKQQGHRQWFTAIKIHSITF